MENKKYFFAVLFLIGIFSFSMYAETSDVSLLPTLSNNSQYIDDLFVDAYNILLSNINTFYTYTQTLALFFFIITIMWSSFKLWFGTIEARKVATDLICKLILYLVLLNIYPYIIANVLWHSSRIGWLSMTDKNGKSILMQEVGNLVGTVDKTTENSAKIINDAIQNGKIKSLTKEDIMQIAASCFWSYDEALSKFKAAYPDFEVTDYAIGANNGKASTSTISSSQLKNDSDYYGTALGWGAYKLFNNHGKGKDIINEEETALKAESDISAVLKGDQSTVMKNMIALADLVEENVTDDSGEKSMYIASTKWSTIKQKVQSYIKAPFIPVSSSKYKFDNLIISPARMVRMSVLVAKLVFNRSSQELSDNGFSLRPKKIAANFIDIICFIILIVELALLLWIACECVLQYCVGIIEFILVSSIGSLFISCILFDGAKSYAANLVRMFINYFCKLLVIVIVAQYSLVMYLKLILRCWGEYEMLTFQNLGYLLFAALLVKTLTQSAPQIASALVSGQPSLNLGDVVRAAQSTMHGMHMAAGAGRKAAGVAAGGAHLAGAGVGTIARQASNHSAINKAAEKVGGAASDAKRTELLKGKAPGATLSEAEEKQVATAGQEAARDFKRDVHQKQWSGKLNSMLDHLKFGKNGGAGQNPFGVEGMAWKAGKQDEQGRNVTQARFNEGLDEYAKKYSENEGFLPPEPKKGTQDGNNNDQNTKKEGANAKETGENHGEEPK